MNPLVAWAFAEELPQPEKLVLAYLACRASPEGLGAWCRESLEQDLGYKPRSIQRLLKSLRDRELLVDVGAHWYQLTHPDAGGDLLPGSDELERHASSYTPNRDSGRPMTLREIADDEDGGVSIDAAAIGETIAGAVTDATDYLMDQLNNFEARFAQQVDRLALFHVEHAPEPPPPDPVLESARYAEMIEHGVDPDTTYRVTAALLDVERVQPGATTAPPAAAAGAPEKPQDARAAEAEQAPGREYDDTAAGRLQRVADILAGGAADKPPETITRAWLTLERDENKHTRKGETDAFLLLYPAIVEAARRYVGTPLAEFVDPQANQKGEAFWDRDPSPAPMEDAALEAEIATMIDAIQRARNPMCPVPQPRTEETGSDGVRRRETILAYYRRVRAVWNQLQQMPTD